MPVSVSPRRQHFYTAWHEGLPLRQCKEASWTFGSVYQDSWQPKRSLPPKYSCSGYRFVWMPYYCVHKASEEIISMKKPRFADTISLEWCSCIKLWIKPWLALFNPIVESRTVPPCHKNTYLQIAPNCSFWNVSDVKRYHILHVYNINILFCSAECTIL